MRAAVEHLRARRNRRTNPFAARFQGTTVCRHRTPPTADLRSISGAPPNSTFRAVFGAARLSARRRGCFVLLIAAWTPIPATAALAQTVNPGVVSHSPVAVNRAAEVDDVPGPSVPSSDNAGRLRSVSPPEAPATVGDIGHGNFVSGESGGAGSDRTATIGEATPGQENVPEAGGDAENGETGNEAARTKVLPPRLGRSRAGSGNAAPAGLNPSLPSPSGWSLWRGLWPLLLVLGLVAAGAFGLRRWSPRREAAETGSLRVVGRTSLTVRHQAVLLQVGHRLVLVGVSGDRMSALCELTDPEEIASLLAQGSVSPTAEGKLFESLFVRERRGFAGLASDVGTAGVTEEGRRAAGPLAELLRRLRSLSSA